MIQMHLEFQMVSMSLLLVSDEIEPNMFWYM